MPAVQALPVETALDPRSLQTAGAVIAYFAFVAERMLPHVVGRPLSVVCCPGGVEMPCLFQRHRPVGSPDSVVPLVVAPETYMEIYDEPGLLGLARLGMVELHTWSARGDQVEFPDLIVFALDPEPGLGWLRVARGAIELRRILAGRGLESFVKTTGGDGLHVIVPIERRHGWDEVDRCATAIAHKLEQVWPDEFTTLASPAARRGKIFVDHQGNHRGAPFLAPYSPRARRGLPVAMPIDWDELATVVPAGFTIYSVPAYLDALPADPWAQLHAVRQSIT